MLEELLEDDDLCNSLITQSCAAEGCEYLVDELMQHSPKDIAKELIEGFPYRKGKDPERYAERRYVLRPLYNLFFTRDASSSVYDRVLINSMSFDVRKRENLIYKAIFKHYFGCEVINAQEWNSKAHTEGGDVQIGRSDLLCIGEGIRTDELERTQEKILHVTPFNSFPSLITASAERRRVYLEWSSQRNAVIIEDDYDSEFALNGKAPHTLFAQTADENVIYINTFSKTIDPSLRAGYMVLPRKYLALYNERVGFYSCTVPMLEQFFLAEWLDSGEFERTISRIRNKNE